MGKRNETGALVRIAGEAVNNAVRHGRATSVTVAVSQRDCLSLLVRDDAVLHIWGATDESWRTRGDLARQPRLMPAPGKAGCFRVGALSKSQLTAFLDSNI